MHIVCIGGGPGGLCFSVLAERANPAHHFLVEQDRLIYRHLTRHAVRWDSLAVIHGGKTDHIGEVGFSAVVRKQLLLDLQCHARELGVELLFQHEVPDPRAHLPAERNQNELARLASRHSRALTRVLPASDEGASRSRTAVSRTMQTWRAASRSARSCLTPGPEVPACPGARASTGRWRRADAWPLLAASATPYTPTSAVPLAMDRSDMGRVLDEFAHAARRASGLGFRFLQAPLRPT